jgi:flagellar basal body-associated protein FliL
MTESQPPSNDQVKPDEVPLEDIDKILESEDPEFTKSLEEVRAVESASDVTIDASAIDESLGTDEKFDQDSPRRGLTHLKQKIRQGIKNLRAIFRAKLVQAAKDFIIILKVRPKQFLFFTVGAVRTGIKQTSIPLRAYQNATQTQRLSSLIIILLALSSAWVLLANFKGIWLPQINEPLLQSFASVADRVETFNPKEGGESFYNAFPQERHEYLFPKMKVNLRRTPDSQNPMGAFEVIAQLDSKDTAIEVSDREVEFSDLLQRVFEDETFNDLESELGKSRLKSRLKRELNQKLTQGWVKDFSFKTFILKP